MKKKRTHEEFIKLAFNIYGKEYEILENYINKRTKIKIKHSNCDNIFDIDPSYFLKGTYKCPSCRINPRLKTTEVFIKEVYNLVKGEYTVIGEYVNAKTKIIIRHEICGYHWNVNPVGFLSGSRCIKCSGNLRKDTQVFKKEVLDLVGDEYAVVGEYIMAHNKIKIKHNSPLCNHYEFEITPANFLSGTRCLKCAKNKKKNTEEFKEEVYNLVGNEYSVLGEYVNSNTKIELKHNKCGFQYEVIPSNFTSQNARCPLCANENRGKYLKISQEEFIQMIYTLVDDEYEVLGEYKNAKTKIKIKHRLCGNVYEVMPTNFTHLGRRCPVCAESKGERRIRKWLVENNLTFKSQKEFNGLVGTGGGLLSYDFYLEKQNILIEYQGEQHERYIEWFHVSDEDFLKQRKHDVRKREYAEQHNINLLEIWYWDFDKIENILINYLLEGD